MNQDQARKFVQETFTQPFDRQRYGTFIRELLNHLDYCKELACNRQYVKDAFKPHINRYERLATYTSPDQRKVDILVVHLTSEAKLTRARTALRNFVADYLKQRGRKDAALVAFVSPSDSAWRFSYVKMEYATVEKPSGEIDAEERLTPARRFSYLVGPAESCHTAKTRFLALLHNTQSDPSLAQIEEAFSVEAVTKEFFQRYKDLFIELKEELDRLAATDRAIAGEFTARKIATADFAKKLMGQIVFLYFLQKKGWLGVRKGGAWGEGPHDFLRKLANGQYGQYSNFFNDLLEPLFYDTLATDRGHEALCQRFNSRIPFLNGGLFEPLGGYDWHKTEILLPNRLFTNSDAVEEGAIGTGILDVFDRYNFTVNEAEPLEKDVAIDPAMLGKVFENLLEVKERKSKGSFYTPREIVHYMCQESLINYLDTAMNGNAECSTHDTSVPSASLQGGTDIPACAPTQSTTPQTGMSVPRSDIESLIHSGDQAAHYEDARIRGTKSYRPKLPASIEANARVLDEKLAAITVCDPAIGSGAFPVGMMQEIVRARTALTPYFNDVEDRSAYHFKRHAIQNCLYGVDIDPGAVEIAKLRLWLSLVVDEDEVQQIKPLPNLDYKVVVGNSLLGVEKNLFNVNLLTRLEELKPKYFDETDNARKHQYKREIDGIIHRLTNGSKDFDFQIQFSEMFHSRRGFDVVIMNPPYGAEFSEAEKDFLKRKYDHIVERIRNSFLYFMGLGYDIVRKDGIVSTIEPNEFLFQIYMTKARRYFVSNSQILYAINTGEDIFEAIVPTCVVALRKRKLDSYKIPVADLRGCTREELPRRLNTHSFRASSSDTVLRIPNSIFVFNPDFACLVNKLSTQCVAFEAFCDDIANGISTSCDEVYVIPKSLVARDGFEPEYVKPCIRGGQFNRHFCPADTGDCVLYVTDDFNPKIGKNILEYLAEHKALLVQKCVEKKKGKREWHILFRGRYEALFRTPKILIRQTADRIVAAPDCDVGYYCIDSVNVALLKRSAIPQLGFLLGLLNSAVVNFYYREISQEGGRVLAQVKPQRIRSLPIPPVPPEKQKAVTHLVDRILAAKAANAEADTSALEREIDQLVYKLYDLTPEEIAIVEEATARTSNGTKRRQMRQRTGEQ